MASETEDCRLYAVRYYNIITNVGGRICRSVMEHELRVKHETSLYDYLNVHKTDIKKNRYINKDLFKKLYPGDKAVLNADDFDITLMMALFINFIFAENNKPNSHIIKNLDKITKEDTLVVDDLARVRCYRNKLHDIADTKVSMTKQDFKKYVEEVTELFVRLETHYTDDSTAKESIDEELKANLNFEDENKIQQKILDEREATKEIENDIRKILEILQTERHRRFEDLIAEISENVFVKTKQYVNAKDTLLEKHVIALHGSPGEGKTTVAKMLLKEIASKARCIAITSAKDMREIGDSADAVLIDDMFGAGTFDKEMFRKWQNNLHLISEWVKTEGQKRYVVITSRTYIFKQAKQSFFIKEFFGEENLIELSTNKLEKEEKMEILKNHFQNVENVPKDEHHDSLLQEISEMKSNDSTAASTVGFPECARLFSHNKELYEKGKSFFETPMEKIKEFISELCDTDDVYVAFYVLWAQESHSIKSKDLELPVDKTSVDILTPIKILQYNPDNVLRNIRNSFIYHTHKGGLIKQDKRETFRFSHYVISDAVGMIAFERNQTAAIAVCDKDFIERLIVIPSRPDNDTCSQIKLQKSRYDQVCSRILDLVIPDSLVDDTERNIFLSKDYLLFKSKLFEDEDFCSEFFRGNTTKLHFLLKSPVRGCDFILQKSKYPVINNLNLKMGLLSFLLWQNENLTFFAKECHKKMSESLTEEETQQELSVALYIASTLGLHEVAQFCIERRGTINSKMILIAFENAKKVRDPSEINKRDPSEIKKEENVLNLLKAKARENKCFPDKDGYYPIHLAALENDLEFVRENIKEKPEDANISLAYLSKDILNKNKSDHEFYLKNASLYHFAVFEGNKELIKLLDEENVPSDIVDSDKRTPFLYAIEIGKSKVIKTLLEIAKKKRKGNESS